MLFKWQVFNKGNAVDVIEESHEQLKKIFKEDNEKFIKITNKLTSWIIPHIETINPQRDNFGPQNLIFSAALDYDFPIFHSNIFLATRIFFSVIWQLCERRKCCIVTVEMSHECLSKCCMVLLATVWNHQRNKKFSLQWA